MIYFIFHFRSTTTANIKPHKIKPIFNVMQFILFYTYFNITVSIVGSHTTLLLCLYLKFSFCKFAR